MNTIYLNGCSFTLGAGLPDCHLDSVSIQSAIGSLIKHNLKLDYYWNESRSGGSNDRVTRKTIDFLSKHKNTWDDILVVIGWTQFTRFELIDELEIANEKSDSKYIQVNSGISHTRKSGDENNFFTHMLDSLSSMRKIVRFGFGRDFVGGDNGIDVEKSWASFMVRHYNVEDRYDKYLDNILYLQSFLKSNNIKYVMFDSLWSINETKLSSKFLQKYQLIDFDRWVWGDNKTSWTEYLQLIDPTNEKTRISWNNDHPNEYGHKIWSELIIKKVKQLYG